MTQYLSSFIIEPVVRQARRLSRPNLGSDSSAEQTDESDAPHAFASPLPLPLPRRDHTATDAASIPDHADALELSTTQAYNHHHSADDNITAASQDTTSKESIEGFGDPDVFLHGRGRLDESPRAARVPISGPGLSHHNGGSGITAAATAAGSRRRAGTNSSTRTTSSTQSSTIASLSGRTLFRAANTSTSTSINEAERSSSELSSQLRQSIDTDRMMARSAAQSAGDGALPEDDGMGQMRKRILQIQNMDCPSTEKSRLIHALMTEQYTSLLPPFHSPSGLRPRSPASTMSQDRPFTPISSNDCHELSQNASPITSRSSVNDDLHVSAADRLPTYWVPPPTRPSAPATATVTPAESRKNSIEEERPERPLGCRHYKRNVKLQCSTCHRWYTCRFCHDEVEDHELVRRETKNMLCMLCGCAQPAAEECRDCGERGAWYYCDICKLWDNDSQKSIYHCDDCGICRVGQGLGKDFFHCKACCACLSISIRDTHRCIERSTDCDCPICGEYMFTSPQTVVFMRCGHSIHQTCYNEHRQNSFKCPICSRSIMNMEMTFRHLDRSIESQPMPSQFQDTKAAIYCNDCCAKSSVKYHWLGLKCAVCDSYNTVQLQIHSDSHEPTSAAADATASDDHMTAAETDTSGHQASSRGRSLTNNNTNGFMRRGATSASAVQHLRLPALDARISQAGGRSSSENNTRYHFTSSHYSLMGERDSGGEDEDDDDEDMEASRDGIGFWGGEDDPSQRRSSRRRKPIPREGVGDAMLHDGEEDEEEEEDGEDSDDDISMEDDDEDEDDDDSDDGDRMDIIGHR